MSAVVDELGARNAGNTDVILEKLCLTPREAAAVLSVGLTTLYGLLERQELRSISIGRARRIPLSSLRAYVVAALERSATAGVCETPAIVAESGTKSPIGARSVPFEVPRAPEVGVFRSHDRHEPGPASARECSPGSLRPCQ